MPKKPRRRRCYEGGRRSQVRDTAISGHVTSSVGGRQRGHYAAVCDCGGGHQVPGTAAPPWHTKLHPAEDWGSPGPDRQPSIPALTNHVTLAASATSRTKLPDVSGAATSNESPGSYTSRNPAHRDHTQQSGLSIHSSPVSPYTAVRSLHTAVRSLHTQQSDLSIHSSPISPYTAVRSLHTQQSGFSIHSSPVSPYTAVRSLHTQQSGLSIHSSPVIPYTSARFHHTSVFIDSPGLLLTVRWPPYTVHTAQRRVKPIHRVRIDTQRCSELQTRRTAAGAPGAGRRQRCRPN